MKNTKCYKGWIYLYINKINGKRYVGQTIDFKARCRRHSNCTDLYIDEAIKKYGIDNFKIIVLEVFTCDSLKARRTRLDTREIYWIERLHSYWYDYPDTGYNLTKGGNSPIDRRHRNAKLHVHDFDNIKDYEKAKYELRKDDILVYQKQYRDEHKEEIKEKRHIYWEKHKEEINKKRRIANKENPKEKTEEQKERQRLATKKYRESHADRVKEQNKKQYQKKKENMTDEEKQRRKEYMKQWRLNHPNYDKERKNKNKI